MGKHIARRFREMAVLYLASFGQSRQGPGGFQNGDVGPMTVDRWVRA